MYIKAADLKPVVDMWRAQADKLESTFKAQLTETFTSINDESKELLKAVEAFTHNICENYRMNADALEQVILSAK